MVRIPSFTRRNDDTAVADNRAADLDRKSERDEERDLARGRATVVERPAPPPTAVPTEVPMRARASMLATLGLVIGVLAAAAVATGVLAMAGVAVGLLGLLVAALGLVATGKPHVAGRFDASIGFLLSLGAVIVGILALAGTISWPDTDVNQVARLADYLRANLPWM